MTTNSNLIPIGEFMRESARNLEIAAAIYSDYGTAREKIINDFFDRVTQTLKRKKKDLQSWQISYDGGFFVQQYAWYRLHKKTWKDRYDIRIEAFNKGERMIYGVWRDKALGRVQRNSPLLQAVRQALPRARSKSRDYYEAEISMDFPEPDWRKAKVLWRMLQDKE